MQNLRDKLMNAGFVSETDKSRADTTAEKAGSDPKRKRRRRPRSLAGDGEITPLVRAVDDHRVRGDIRGASEFQLEERNGTVRMLLLTNEIVHGLNIGRMAIVEVGSPARFVLVHRDAVAKIRTIDPEAIRFFNDEGVTS